MRRKEKNDCVSIVIENIVTNINVVKRNCSSEGPSEEEEDEPISKEDRESGEESHDS